MKRQPLLAGVVGLIVLMASCSSPASTPSTSSRSAASSATPNPHISEEELASDFYPTLNAFRSDQQDYLAGYSEYVNSFPSAGESAARS